MANEKRLIDANELKWKLGQVKLYVPWLRFGKAIMGVILESYRGAAFNEIDNAPTVNAVEVVRCKDCKNYIYSSFAMGMRCKHDGVEWGKDDFCSYGERKDND